MFCLQNQTGVQYGMEVKSITTRNVLPFAPSTFAVYSAQYQRWEEFCFSRKVNPLPANPRILQEYLAAHVRSKSWLNQFQAALAIAHKAKGIDNPFLNPKISLFLRAIHKSADNVRKQANPLKYADYERIKEASVAGCPRWYRDLSIIGLMRDCLLRSSELRALNVDDIEEGLCRVRRSKTDQEGKGAWLYVSEEVLMNIEKWKNYLNDVSGSLFRPLTRSNNVIQRSLGINSIARILQRCCKEAKIDTCFSSHSMRVGMAQDLAEEGETLLNIQIVGRWKSPSMPAYYCRKQAARKSAVSNYYEKKEK